MSDLPPHGGIAARRNRRAELRCAAVEHINATNNNQQRTNTMTSMKRRYFSYGACCHGSGRCQPVGGPCLCRRKDDCAGADQPAGAVLQPDERRRAEGRQGSGREARHLQCQQRSGSAEQRYRNLYQQKVDGIAVVAIDVNGIMPAVKQAAAANIPVVAIDSILPEGPQKAQIGVDNARPVPIWASSSSIM